VPDGKPTPDENGDLLFPSPTLGRLALTRALPDLRRVGWSAEKRAAWYVPDPNVWRREEVRDASGAVVGVRLYVPRRYQWFARVVWRVNFAELLVEA